jgi:hypothetical protein
MGPYRGGSGIGASEYMPFVTFQQHVDSLTVHLLLLLPLRASMFTAALQEVYDARALRVGSRRRAS